MEENKNGVVKATLIEEVALEKINQYINLGMQIPEGFNPTNSLKKARMMLNDMKVNGKPVLQVCSQASIIQCLIDACCKGLDISSSQAYFIPRNGQMTLMESVYGRIARARRASKYYEPIVQYVYEGDDFEIGVDTQSGKTIIKKHETSLENLDKPIIAAYAFVADNNNNTTIHVMTRKEWLTSWKKSPNGCAVAKEFEKDMIFRSIIKKSTKSLVNADVQYVSHTQKDDDDLLAGDKAPIVDTPTSDFTFIESEVVEDAPTDVIDVETGEVKKSTSEDF